MKTMPDAMGNGPAPDDIRAAVDRIVTSDVFSRSPQLGAFLRFVVEAVLRGKADRIKAYTIGVEVLRRDTSFDPQADPIVRVEATRLRRALERYYAAPRQDDPVIVDLPRGSYVPTFRWRETGWRAPGLVVAALSGGWTERLHSWPGIAALLAVIVLGAAAFGIHYRIRPDATATVTPLRDADARRAASSLPPGNGMPVIQIERIRVIGTPTPRAIAVDRLFAKIRDAFTRFDTINVAADGSHADASEGPGDVKADYRLSGAVEYVGDAANAWFTLTSTAEGKVVWSRNFERVMPTGGKGVTDDSIVIALTNSLLQSYGVIRARDRANQLASGMGDPRYRCVLEAADSIRTADRQSHDFARACLEQLTRADPGFAVGLTFLALVYNREFQLEYPVRSGDAAPLDRALKAVRESIALHPEGSRGYLALMVVQFNRRDLAAGLAAGEKCLSLNKYDMLAMGEFGGRLVMSGEVARGMQLLREAGSHGAVRPAWHHIYMFIGAYMQGDMAEATRAANEIPNDNVALGQVARALSASAAGRSGEVRVAVDKLQTLGSAWSRDPRGELARLIYEPAIVDRLARDLAAAGLRGGA